MRLMSTQDAGPAGHYYLGHSDRRISHVPALTVYIAPFRHTLIFRVRKAVTLLRIRIGSRPNLYNCTVPSTRIPPDTSLGGDRAHLVHTTHRRAGRRAEQAGCNRAGLRVRPVDLQVRPPCWVHFNWQFEDFSHHTCPPLHPPPPLCLPVSNRCTAGASGKRRG
jgi:hypothetical protein